jgi:hypothetical protein
MEISIKSFERRDKTRRKAMKRIAIGVMTLAVLLIAIQALAEEKAVEHEYLSLTLPAGWVTQDMPSNFEKEVIGWLKSEKIPGTSITVSCYRGRRYNYSNIRIAALKTIAAVYPKGQEMLKKPKKIRTDSGYKAVVELWRGAIDSSGLTVYLQTPMGIVKTKHCWILMLGYTPDSSGPQLEEDFMKIINSTGPPRTKKKVSPKKDLTAPSEVKELPKQEVKESPMGTEDSLIQEGPTLIAKGQYSRVLELIEDLPEERRRHVQVQTLECFANLKGWMSDRNTTCKSRWWSLRQQLINSGDKEATPVLVIFLKDEDPWLRIYAAELLGYIGDKRALKDLREAGENDANRKVRGYAKKAYERISGEKF